MSKKIIGFLGTGDYRNVKYGFIDENGTDQIIETRFVQEAIHKLVGEDAILYVGLTDGERGSRKTNWESGERKVRDYDTGEIRLEHRIGLKEILDKKSIKYRELELENGANENEIWENFDRIFDVLEEGDELYIDITHSFRSLPIIIMSIINYAKFIKNISIKGIYYGAFDVKDENGVAPIIDLSIFNDITDWTIGAEKFIKSGNSKDLINQIDEVLVPLLREAKGKDEHIIALRKIKVTLNDFSRGLYAVRSGSISGYGKDLKKQLENIDEILVQELKPFERVMEKIKDMVESYSTDEIKNINHTIKLLSKLGLIQQAYTLLQENILNYLIYKGNIQEYYNDPRKRDYVKDRLYEEVSGSKRWLNVDKDELMVVNNIRNSIASYCTEDLARLYDDIGDYRNDLNHAGYRLDAKKSLDDFEKKIDEFITQFEEIIDRQNLPYSDTGSDTNPKVLLIFSHKLTDKQIQDAKENLNIQEFIYLPKELQEKWSSISPEVDDIGPILEDIKTWIKDRSCKNDYILVQGDFGANYEMVNYCKGLGLRAIYSTTVRRAKETIMNDGKIEVAHIFEHVRFREY